MTSKKVQYTPSPSHKTIKNKYRTKGVLYKVFLPFNCTFDFPYVYYFSGLFDYDKENC